MGFKAQRTNSDNTGDFSETVKFELLMCSNSEGNNNKFYILEVQRNPSTDEHRLMSHYGRLANDTVDKGVYELRGPATLTEMDTEFEKILKSKKRAKTKTNKDGKKYKEQYEKVDVVAPNVGSINIKKASGAAASASVTKSGGANTGMSAAFQSFEPASRKLLGQLLQENVHAITSSTSLTMTASGLETPLGPVTNDQINLARQVLDQLRGLKALKDNPTQDEIDAIINMKDVRQANTEFFSKIPHPVAVNNPTSHLIVSEAGLLDKYDLLEQMEATLQVTSDDGDDKDHDLGIEMQLAPKDVTEYLTRKVDQTRKHRTLSNWKVARVYEFINHKERDRYMARAAQIAARKPNGRPSHKYDYEELDLFHGSRNSNCLSIMMNGFYVPPVNATHVTGRMFGNGVYAADASTKALNYSTGYWGGTRNKFDNSFLFVTRFAMGKVHTCKRALYSGVPNGSNSIFAQGGADLQNNEFIVPDVAQTTVTHVIEFEQ